MAIEDPKNTCTGLL